MQIEPSGIAGLLQVRAPVRHDDRGSFREVYRLDVLRDALGYEPHLRQGNVARSRAGVLRGFHAEPWIKLIDVVFGTAHCAIADLRPDSPTFGEVEEFLLKDEHGERTALYLEEGLGNAYYAVTDVVYGYSVGHEWDPSVDNAAVAWDDPDLAVDWPTSRPILSDADRRNPTLRERFPDHPRFW